MTMSFEPLQGGMFDAFTIGDSVAFDFVEREDAARIVIRIEKR